MNRTVEIGTSHTRSRVVIIGARGFVGSTIRRVLTDHGVETRSLNHSDMLGEVGVVAERLARSLRDDDVLVLAAARAPCKNAAMLATNIAMAEVWCEALSRRPVAHVVYISSDAVYADEPCPITEASWAAPSSLHGAMHLARELAIRTAFAGPLAIIRLTLLYGTCDPHYGYGPNRFRREAAARKTITLFGEGEEMRDHMAVEDVAELVHLVVKHRTEGVLNGASGTVASFRAIAEFAADFFPERVPVVGTPRVSPMPHGGFRSFDISLLRTLFPSFHPRNWEVGFRENLLADSSEWENP